MTVASLDAPALNEARRITKALAAIRRRGGLTVTGMCCQSCSWAEAERRAETAGGVTMVALINAQALDDAFPDGRRKRMRRTLFVHHDGDSAALCGAFRAQGLRVYWDGDMDKAIQVLPDID